MKIDVIVPVYNQEKYLLDALNSIAAQDIETLGVALQILVVDAGSTDSSREIAAAHPLATLICANKHVPAAVARNLGLRASSASHIAFLDSDDLWVANKLALQIEALHAQDDTYLVFGAVENFISSDVPPRDAARIALPEESQYGPHVGTLFCARATFDSVGPFDESYSYAEFVEWFLRARDLNIPHVLLETVLLKRRIHQSNTGIVRKNEQHQLLRALKASRKRST